MLIDERTAVVIILASFAGLLFLLILVLILLVSALRRVHGHLRNAAAAAMAVSDALNRVAVQLETAEE